MNKQKIIIVVLSVLLFSLVQYVLYEKVSESISQELVNSYESGYLEGITDAARLVYYQTENCEPTSVTIDKEKMNAFNSGERVTISSSANLSIKNTRKLMILANCINLSTFKIKYLALLFSIHLYSSFMNNMISSI